MCKHYAILYRRAHPRVFVSSVVLEPIPCGTERQLYTRVELLFTASTGFPGGASGKESASLYVRSRFDPWVWKTPWSRIWNPRQYFCLDTSLAGYSPRGGKSQTRWVTELTIFTSTLLIQATVISCLVFCNNRLADCSASSLMPLMCKLKVSNGFSSLLW